MHILIVEDSPYWLEIMQSALEKRGQQIKTAPNLLIASQLLAAHNFDSILLDLTLADCSGVETFYQIKQQAPEIPIVLCVSISEQDLALAACDMGAQGYVIKGVASEEAVYKRIEFAVQKTAMETALKNSESRLRIILENSYDAFISTDDQWKITEWNRQAEITFGWSKEEMLGQALAYIVPQHFRRQYARRIEKYFAKRSSKLVKAAYEMVAIDKSGKELVININIFRLAENGKSSYCAFIRDITETKKLSEELERRVDERTERLERSNEELRQFAKIASHDLQEPLRAVQGFARLLADNSRDKLDQDAMEFIDYILDGTDRMQKLIQAVLSHSHISHDPEANPKTSCKSVIDDVLANLSVSIKETDASFEIIDELPEVAIERSHLMQLFQNLLSNAIKYRKKGIPPRIVIRVDTSGDFWLFSVRDNGIGFEQKYADRIFDMFARLHGKTQYTGTGMGLAICKRIVTSHGGTISVESEPGEGSIFLFTLPAVKRNN